MQEIIITVQRKMATLRPKNKLGMIYEMGNGVGSSIDMALKWYGLSAKQGNSDAKKALERINIIVID